MENIEFVEFEAENGHKIKFEKTGGEIYTLGIKLDTFHDYVLENHETIALRDFLNSLDLEKKKDCKDGQHSGDTGKCSECGTTYIHG